MKKNKILASMNRYGHNKESANMQTYREEIVKDSWDVRNLGISYNSTRAEYHLNFEKIDEVYRALIKKYLQERIFVQDAIKFSTARSELHTLIPFIKFIVFKHPEWTELKKLNRNDMEEYLELLKTTPMRGNKDTNFKERKPTNYNIWRMIGGLENFLYYIQRYEWREAPDLPIRKLIFQEDRPKLPLKQDEDYDYVSDYVWAQIVDNLNLIEKQYLPILLLMEATGFRLIDILSLKQNCLQNINGDYWVKFERENSRYQSPMIPITIELAELLNSNKVKVKERFSDEENPNNLFFLRYSGRKGVGTPFQQLTILRYLDRFAEKANIIDETGETFHFTATAFKHRFGLKILKTGLNMGQVHQLIANVTSEMPMIYARKIQKESFQIDN